MFQKLVNHNNDIRLLVEKGYAIAFDNGYLIVRDIPYLDKNLDLQMGVIVAKLDFVDEFHVVQTDHQVFFAGDIPHGLDKEPIKNLAGGPLEIPLSESITDFKIQRSFSNKPIVGGKFADFFEKIESYVSIISGPAMHIHDVTPYTFRVIKDISSDSVFKFSDTLTSRAEISDIVRKFKDDVIAIIGLGGTGSYVLDYIVKTPVKEIRAFDFDSFHVHNSYRSPGRLDESELGKTKSEVYSLRYNNFRMGLSFNNKKLDKTCVDDLEGVTFAFVCVDSGSSRKEIFELLLSMKIPFIDVGMGLLRNNDLLNGMLRMTYFSLEDGEKIKEKNIINMSDNPDDIYKSNIQISELNALNASFAVIKFKQFRKFYAEELPNYNSLFEIKDLKIISESDPNEN